MWLDAEYLLWSVTGDDSPALVSTNPTVSPDLVAADTSVLFGGGDLLNDDRSGWRIRFGMGSLNRTGLEGEYFRFSDEDVSFSATSDGTTILGRPFFNVNPLDAAGNADLPVREFASLTAFPNEASGSINVDLSSALESAAVRWRFALGNRRSRFGRVSSYGVLGYRHLRLADTLRIRDVQDSLIAADPGRIDVSDHFDSTNNYHGFEFGSAWQLQLRGCLLRCDAKLGLGNSSQDVSINGTTTITGSLGSDGTYATGLLAAPSNIGSYQQDEFAMLPELNLAAVWHLNRATTFNVGYSLMYLSRVARATEQIDRNLNPNFFAPPVGGAPQLPSFQFRTTDMLAHGLTLGLSCNW